MKNVLIAFLFSVSLGVAAFSGWRYFGALRDRVKAENEALKDRQQLVAAQTQLKREIGLHDGLAKENQELQVSLKESEGEVRRLTLEKAQKQERLFSLIKEIKWLSKEYSRAQEEKIEIEKRLNLAEEKNTQLEAKFHSPLELKKALRQVKIEMHKSHPPVAAIHRETVKSKAAQITEGNLGFLLKDGLSTYKPRLKIEVNAAND